MAFPNSVMYPFNFVNRAGIPLIESNAVTVSDSQVVVTISNNAFRFLEDRGVFLFRLNQAIPEGSDTLPVVFSWTGFNQQLRTQPLTLVGGAAATEEELEGIGVYLVYYDKRANILQLMTTGIGTEQTAASNVNNG